MANRQARSRLVMRATTSKMLNKQNSFVDILGLPVSRVTMEDLLRIANESIASRRQLLLGVLNVAKVIYARRDRQLRESLKQADLIVADGLPIVWLSWLLGAPLPERVPGVDIMLRFLNEANKKHYRVYFLGARPSVLQKLIETVKKDYQGVYIVGQRDGYFGNDQEQCIAEDVRKSHADILFVGISSPKKENFLRKWHQYVNVPVCHGVGGSFDVLVGVTRRAPIWMQKAGLEWLFRLIQEPRRMWKRYLVTNTIFILLGSYAVIRTCPSRLFRIFALKSTFHEQ